MGFLDSNSSVVDSVLTRRGRELLARNDGSFKITKFAFGDDEVNYQLYNLNSDDDSDILNLPILEPSSNDDAALRYRLVTLPKGASTVSTLTITPNFLILAAQGNKGTQSSTRGVVSVETVGGSDNSYTVLSRDESIVIAKSGTTNNTSLGSTFTVIVESVASNESQTIIDIIGNDTGAIATLSVSVVGDNT